MTARKRWYPRQAGKTGKIVNPVYALKVVAGGRGPVARGFEYGKMLTTGRWYKCKTTQQVARGKDGHAKMDRKGRYVRAKYARPVLCMAGWHVWPASSGSPLFYGDGGWRGLRNNIRRQSSSTEVWLVQYRGRYIHDGNKLAADEMRFVRVLSAAEQKRLPRMADPDKYKKALGLGPKDKLLVDLDHDWDDKAPRGNKRQSFKKVVA